MSSSSSSDSNSSSTCTDLALAPPRPTEYEGELEELTPEQFSEYWDKLSYPVRKAWNRTKRGELAPVSDEELKKRRDAYLAKPENDSDVECS